MPDTKDSVLLLHIPLGNYAAFARVYPTFTRRADACAYLKSVARPQDYRVSFVVHRKPALLRGDRFLAQFSPGSPGRHKKGA